MGWKFYGYAAVYGTPDNDRDIFVQGCFTAFLQRSDHLEIPMLDGHDPAKPLGSWVKMLEDGFGLLVVGELTEGLPPLRPPFPGLSVDVVDAKGSPHSNPWGGKICRFAALSEISLVANPTHPAARILGDWV